MKLHAPVSALIRVVTFSLDLRVFRRFSLGLWVIVSLAWSAPGFAEVPVVALAGATTPVEVERTGLSAHPLFEPSDTALISARSHQVGLFSPLRWRIDAQTEVALHPLLFFVAPNLALRRQVWSEGALTLAFEGELGCPTGLMRLLQTNLWGNQYDIGWIASLGLGALLSWQPEGVPLLVSLQVRERWAPTVIGETTIVHNDIPLLEETVAPITDGPTTLVGLDLDLYPLEWLAFYVDVTAQWSPASGPYAQDINLDLRGKLMAAVAWTPGLSTSLGFIWVSSQLDSGRLSGFLPLPPTSLPFPLLDVIWRW